MLVKVLEKMLCIQTLDLVNGWVVKGVSSRNLQMVREWGRRIAHSLDSYAKTKAEAHALKTYLRWRFPQFSWL